MIVQHEESQPFCQKLLHFTALWAMAKRSLSEIDDCERNAEALSSLKKSKNLYFDGEFTDGKGSIRIVRFDSELSSHFEAGDSIILSNVEIFIHEKQ